MKEYGDSKPLLMIGRGFGDFLGEYMAGGRIVVLGLESTMNKGGIHKSRFIGTGMHGGVIYVCGNVRSLPKEVKVINMDKEDIYLICSLAEEFSRNFNLDPKNIVNKRFVKIVPTSYRPYGRLYAR